MTLKEISYIVLELMRGGSIVDDERMDQRLIHGFIATKRAEYLRSQIERRYGMSPNAIQYLKLPVIKTVINGDSYLISEDIPSFIQTRFGLAINTISTDLYKNVMFKYVTENELPYVGNGRFNKAIVFGAYSEGNLVLKSKSVEFGLVTEVKVAGILNDPSDHPDFEEDITEYPLDYDGIEYVKSKIMSQDARIFLGAITDEINDSSGEVKE
jgi:hypothetical protein